MSRHRDGSVHAEGWVALNGGSTYVTGFGQVKCSGGATFETSEAPG